MVEFDDGFAEPKGLHPKWSFDHAIPLVAKSPPVNIKPYRYPHFQINEIEQEVEKMLEEAIIQPSTSPFISAMWLVKEKMEHGESA